MSESAALAPKHWSAMQTCREPNSRCLRLPTSPFSVCVSASRIRPLASAVARCRHVNLVNVHEREVCMQMTVMLNPLDSLSTFA